MMGAHSYVRNSCDIIYPKIHADERWVAVKQSLHKLGMGIASELLYNIIIYAYVINTAWSISRNMLFHLR